MFRPFGPLSLCKPIVEGKGFRGTAFVQYFYQEDSDMAQSNLVSYTCWGFPERKRSSDAFTFSIPGWQDNWWKCHVSHVFLILLFFFFFGRMVQEITEREKACSRAMRLDSTLRRGQGWRSDRERERDREERERLSCGDIRARKKGLERGNLFASF